jgi:flagellar biosynthesis component FlhA
MYKSAVHPTGGSGSGFLLYRKSRRSSSSANRRSSVVVQCVSILVAVYIFPRLPNSLQLIFFLIIVNGGLGIVLMIVYIPEPFSFYYYAGLILVLMLAYLIPPLNSFHCIVSQDVPKKRELKGDRKPGSEKRGVP